MSNYPTMRAHVLGEAADLLSEHGENPEYDRAIVELANRLLGGSTDDVADIAAQLRELHPIEVLS